MTGAMPDGEDDPLWADGALEGAVQQSRLALLLLGEAMDEETCAVLAAINFRFWCALISAGFSEELAGRILVASRLGIGGGGSQ